VPFLARGIIPKLGFGNIEYKQIKGVEIMKRNLLILAIILLIGFIVNSCGDDDEQPQPTQQSKDIILAAGKKVTVTYTALPGATPSWWSKLSTQLQSMEVGFPAGTYTLTVTPDGTDAFVAGAEGSKSATVSESWLSSANDTDVLMSIATHSLSMDFNERQQCCSYGS